MSFRSLTDSPREGTSYICIGGCVVWRVKFKPKNMDSLKILCQNMDLAYPLLKNMGKIVF